MPIYTTVSNGQIHVHGVSREEAPTFIDYLCQSICAPVESGPADDALLSDPRDLPKETAAEFWHRKHMEAAKELRRVKAERTVLRALVRAIEEGLDDFYDSMEGVG